MSALSGLKIVDFSWAVTGPLMTKYLADFGATVVRIESQRHLDTLRLSAPYAEATPGLNRSGYYTLINSNKYSITINLDKPLGPDMATRLIEWSDVVVESFRPGVMEKYGLGYERLKQLKPEIIMLRASSQGQTGPYASQPGLGYQTTGLVGFSLLVGWPDRDPLPLPVAYTDYIAYNFGAAALLAALNYRQKTGKGTYLDLSQIECSLHFLAPVIMDYAVNSREPRRTQNSSPDSAPHSVYRCQGDDRWCAIAVTNDAEWQALVSVIGQASWTSEPRFATLLGRKRNESELNRLIEAWTVNFPAEELMNRLQSAGVPCGVVADGERLVNDPQLKSRGYYWELEHSEIGLALHAGQPFKMSKTPAVPRMSSPCLGEHTELVCKEFLKMSDEEFLRLFDSGCFD